MDGQKTQVPMDTGQRADSQVGASGPIRPQPRLSLTAWLCLAAVGATGITLIYQITKQTLRNRPRAKTRLLKWLMSWNAQPQGNCNVRSTFNAQQMMAMRPSGAHTHPNSAITRSQASLFITAMARDLGKEAFFYQMSASDQRNGRIGSRDPFWSKDLAAEMKDDETRAGFTAIVDVDYYIDMEERLSHARGPVVLYTLVPEKVAKDTGEYSYTFNANDEIEYTVSGGGRYTHELWDYGTDTLIVENRSYLGLWVDSVAYNVDRRQVDSDHQLICLTPIASLRTPLLGLSLFVAGSRLKRLKVVQNLTTSFGKQAFLRLDSQGAEGRMRSTGMASSYVEVTTTVSVDDTLAVQAKLGKTDLTVAQVKTTTKNDDTSVAVLTAYHRAKSTNSGPVVFPITNAFQTFEFSPDNADPESKASVQAFMSPFVDGTFVPTISKGNDEQAIKGRVENVRANVGPMPPKYLAYMQEFLGFLIPEPHLAHPVDHEEVFERQARPTQRRILDEACSVGSLDESGEVGTFMKKEPYAKVTDPRNITIIPGRNKYAYSRYMYAFSECLRQTKWYAFGKTPLEIAERVAEICSEADDVTGTDLSRCDGRISAWFRQFERMSMLRLFSEVYAQDLQAVMATQFGQRGKTSTGYKYSTGDSRLSGSPETADFNSVDNALMAYITYREEKSSPEVAWNKLGVYGGDDGLSPDAPAKTYTKVAKNFGQVLEAEVLPRHSPGVNFLARFYSPEVWTGDTSSMCDIKRQMLKFHLTANLPRSVTALAKLIEKARGYLATDRNTPIIGDICRAVEQAFGSRGGLTITSNAELANIGSWFSRYAADVQFPNVNHDNWMDSLIYAQFPEFDRDLLSGWLDQITGKALPAIGLSILSPPVCAFSRTLGTVPADVVVDGDIVRSAKHETNTRQELVPEIEVCKHYLNGKCTYGNKCRKAHVGDVAQAPIECHTFRTTGTCKYVNCKFLHNARPVPTRSAKSVAPSGNRSW